MENSSNMKALEFYKLAKYQMKLKTLGNGSEEQANLYRAKITHHTSNLKKYATADEVDELFQIGGGHYKDTLKTQENAVMSAIAELKKSATETQLSNQVASIQSESDKANENHSNLVNDYRDDITSAQNSMRVIQGELGTVRSMVGNEINADDYASIMAKLGKIKRPEEMFAELESAQEQQESAQASAQASAIQQESAQASAQASAIQQDSAQASVTRQDSVQASATRQESAQASATQ